MTERKRNQMTIGEQDKCTEIAREVKRSITLIHGKSTAKVWAKEFWLDYIKGDKQEMDIHLSYYIGVQPDAVYWETLRLIAEGYYKKKLVMPDKLAEWANENLKKDRKLPRQKSDNYIRGYAMHLAVEECIVQGYRPIYTENGGRCICEGVAYAWPKENSEVKGETLGARTVYYAYIEFLT